MKDTSIPTAMTAGVNTAWLEAQTGVRYKTLKRHDRKWLRREGPISSKHSACWPPVWHPRTGDVRNVAISPS